MMMMLVLVLLPVAFLLPPGAGAGEIIGGREARPHSRPYMAYLEIRREGKTYSCGGFLVSKNFVLTAAHCDGDKITVHLGAHNVRRPDGNEQVIYAVRHVPHPLYKNTTYNNDIMLLKLQRNARMTNAVRLIRLPPPRDIVPLGAPCSVAGWGRTSLNHTTDTLREVRLTVIGDRICDRKYGHLYNASSMLCAGKPRDQKTVYKGDSGGPLVCGGVAEGIVLYGKKNSIAPPAVYTRISPFMPWINDTMKGI